MKKLVLTLIALVSLSAGVGFAAPVNDLGQGQTALGIGSDTFYLEHKLADKFTIGFQNVDRGGSGNMNDIYGQLQFTDNLRGIVGSRDFDYSGSKMYLGMAINGPLSPNWAGYASLIAGSEFKELQVGANVGLSHNVDLNLSYHSFMPDGGNNRNGVGIGATLKF